MSAPVDLSGQRFGLLVACAPAPKQAERDRWWSCKCDCGGTGIFAARLLRCGNNSSCGCLRKPHGMSSTSLHVVWCSMLQRCSNPKRKDWHRYGGRGIHVCSDWQSDFRTFFNWALKNGYEKGLQLDREDNDQGYSPENCRFVTSAINNRNRRSTKLTGDAVTIIRSELEAGGPRGIGRALSSRYGVSPATISRIARGKYTAADKAPPLLGVE